VDEKCHQLIATSDLDIQAANTALEILRMRKKPEPFLSLVIYFLSNHIEMQIQLGNAFTQSAVRRSHLNTTPCSRAVLDVFTAQVMLQ
jgi:hypothetical protein